MHDDFGEYNNYRGLLSERYCKGTTNVNIWLNYDTANVSIKRSAKTLRGRKAAELFLSSPCKAHEAALLL